MPQSHVRGIGVNYKNDRQEDDYYATPPRAIDDLLSKISLNKGDEVLVDWIDKSKKANTPLRSCKIGLSNKVNKPIVFGFNTILLRDAFMLLSSLKAKQVTVKYTNNTLRPIMLEIDDTQIVVAPVRFEEARV